MKVFKQTDSLFEALFDKMADWLRKLNANTLGSARVVSNPIFVILQRIIMAGSDAIVKILNSRQAIVNFDISEVSAEVVD